MRVLNVGAGGGVRPIHPIYDGWEVRSLDINPEAHPDVLMDAREMDQLPGLEYDSIYASHNLEHYYRQDLPRVLNGFRHCLKEDGFIMVQVPNMLWVANAMMSGHDIEDVMYVSPAGPIKAVDMIYGYGAYIDGTNDWMMHKNGFTPKSLGQVLANAGFPNVYIGGDANSTEIFGYAFMQHPSAEMMDTLKLKDHASAAGDKAVTPSVSPDPVASGPIQGEDHEQVQ